MKFKLIVFSCMLVIKNDIFVTTNSLPLDLKDTTLEQYPFMALIAQNWWCTAVLITRQHLITPRICVNSEMRPTITVYLGFEQLPMDSQSPCGKNTQIHRTSRVFKHDPFTNATKKNNFVNFVNDIAIVELEQPITYSDTVYPAKLISGEELKLYEREAVAQVVNWHKSENAIMSVETVELLNKSLCDSLFGGSLRHDEKWCARSIDGESECGDVMTFRNKVAGLMIPNKCSLPVCANTFLNIVPFLQWISEKVNVTVEELTGTEKKMSEDQEKNRRTDTTTSRTRREISMS